MNGWIKKMPPFILLLMKLFLFQVLCFSALRLIFYFFTCTNAVPASFGTKLLAFGKGTEFDRVVICYLLIPAFLFLFLHSLFRKDMPFFRKFISILLLMVLMISDLIWTIDIPYYNQFGNHLNKQALLWDTSPGFVFGMVFGSFSYWGYLIIFILFGISTYLIVKRFFTQYHIHQQRYVRPKKIFTFLFFLTAIGLLFIGARGRFSAKSSTHEGLAVISDNSYINNLGLNPNFTFIRSLLSDNTEKYTPPVDIDKQIAFTRNYLGIQSPFEQNLNRAVTTTEHANNYNVVVVVMESMCLFKMGYYNGKDLTPQFNAIIKESVFFDKFFSSGIHTYNGLFSGSSGYPSILAEHSLMDYRKKPFQSLGMLLGKEQYDSYFFTTHDPHFDNMSGYFTLNGFKNIYGQYDMPSKKAISSLGVPDHVLFDKFISVMNERKSKEPFVTYIMTASDHGPWAVPDNITFEPTADNERDRATQYADWALGHLMSESKKQDWYKNTVFLFLGDHGLSMGHTYEMPLSYHHIPFVVHHPASLKPDTIHNLGYQPDVNATVMGLLNRPYTNESFGIDLFKQSHPFVMFTADDKIGCVDTNGNYYYELLETEVKRLRKYEKLDPRDYYQTNRKLADSLEYGAKSILETARFFVHRDYFVY